MNRWIDIFVYVYVDGYRYMCVCMCIYIYLYTCVCLSVYLDTSRVNLGWGLCSTGMPYWATKRRSRYVYIPKDIYI